MKESAAPARHRDPARHRKASAEADGRSGEAGGPIVSETFVTPVKYAPVK